MSRIVRTQARGESEATFQAAVIDLARHCGWRVYHTYDSRRSKAGWPDLALCKPPRLILAELKAETGRVRTEQREWLAALTRCLGLEVYLWRPSDWPAVERALMRGPTSGGASAEV
jgi:hypothetical protein